MTFQTTPVTSTTNSQPTASEQAAKFLSQAAGYVATRTLELGLRHGLIAELASRPQGATPDSVAAKLGLDPFYTAVWCRTAAACELLDSEDDETFQLAPHLADLMLDRDSPGYTGGLPTLLLMPEMFEGFSHSLTTGERTWWDNCRPEWKHAVSETGRAFYSRLIPDGLSQVPGLADLLARPISIAELGSGVGTGLLFIADTYPQASVTGVDCDAHSLDVARDTLREAGAEGRAQMQQSMLEDWDATEQFDLVFINISMHECRDLETVADNVLRSLKPGGCFVISDLPFPESTREARNVPGMVMSGIQFFEARIDDQLLPTRAYVDLLTARGFRDVGSLNLMPTHDVTYGWK